MTTEEEARHPLVWTVDHRPGTTKETPMAEEQTIKVKPDLSGLRDISGALRAFGEAAIQLADALQGRGKDTGDGTELYCPVTLRNEVHSSHYRGDSRWHCPGLPWSLPVALCPVGEKHLSHHWTLAVGLSGPKRALCPGDGQNADGQTDIPVQVCPAFLSKTQHLTHVWNLPLVGPGQCPGYPLPDSEPGDFRNCSLWRTDTPHADHPYGQDGHCPGV